MEDTPFIHLQNTGFIRLNQILKIIPVSRSTWWHGCKTGRFPQPYKLSPRVTAWKASDIQDCMANFKQSGWLK
ncbi:helix-turn-helix transcriptional regulator [Spirosoma linguale]|uniref:Phage transcriptional regulator, AlpA n=1 Tax=Spirosoma linguale (strain ATCC 33905 / DSM 74 / LMG 10896 / Claus 1) TaxID=504472 RepID=D2QCK8_SPILD|nr:phage transcriptional regulator, AlpA [Spirosoma linguale DSM 74]